MNFNEVKRLLGGMGFNKFMRLLGGPAAVIVIVVALLEFPHALDAAHNDGQHGIFTAQTQVCRDSRGGKDCKFHGTFESNDGKVRLADVWMDTEVAKKISDQVPAQAVDGGRHDKVYALGSNEWKVILIIVAAAVVYLGWWSWEFVVRSLRNRRTSAD